MQLIGYIVISLENTIYLLIKRSLQCQRDLFTQQFTKNESVTRTSYKIVQKIIKPRKLFTDDSYIKVYIMEAAKDLCSQKTDLFVCTTELSGCSVVRKTEKLGEYIEVQLRQNSLGYSLVLEYSTDLTSASQPLIFIRGVNLDFQVLKNWYQFTACTEQQLEKIFFLEVQKALQSYNL